MVPLPGSILLPMDPREVAAEWQKGPWEHQLPSMMVTLRNQEAAES